MIDGETPLHAAANEGHLEIVRVLLESNAAVDSPMFNGETALLAAASEGFAEIVRLLLSCKANVDAADDNGAANGHSEVVAVLLAEHASVDAVTEDGATPLYAACKDGHLDVVRILLESHGDVDMATHDGAAPLLIAAQNGHVDVVQQLLDNHAAVDRAVGDGQTPLYQAVVQGRVEVMALLLANNADVDMATDDGQTPLYAASQVGYLDAVKLLLEHHASVENAGDNKETPLYTAAQHGHDSIVEILLTSEAQAEARSIDGSTPLIAACRSGHTEVAQRLLNSRAPISAADDAGDTPLLAAAKFGHFDLVGLPIDAGALVLLVAADGETVLTCAARHGDLRTVSLLNERGLLSFRYEPDARESLVCATLGALRDQGDQLHEFSTIWEGVADHLLHIHDHISESKQSEDDHSVVNQFVAIVARFVTAHSGFPVGSDGNLVARLVASRATVSRLRDLHMEISALEHLVGLDQAFGTESDWTTAFESDQAEILSVFRAAIDGDAQLLPSLIEEADRIEALSLLQHELRAHGDKCSPNMLKLLQHALDRMTRLSNVKDYSTPVWHIPPHEFGVEQARDPESEEVTRLVQGKWLGSEVKIKEYQASPPNFAEDVDTWSNLSHPNVIKLLGASHLRTPYSTVFENVASTNLREYLDEYRHRHLLWQKLYEAARGLQYLHERGIFVADLSCDHIWVGTDGSAKINLFSGDVGMNELSPEVATASGFEESIATEAVRWRSPERMRGGAPSSASDVYSLGMCIVEAMTGGIPWREETSTSKIAAQVANGFRPERPVDCTCIFFPYTTSKAPPLN